MRSPLHLFTTFTVLLMFSCTPLRTETRYDPAVNFRSQDTFAWIPAETSITPVDGVDSDFEARLRKHISRALEEKGLARSASAGAPDLHVAFYTALEESTWVSTWNAPYSPFDPVRPRYISGWNYGYGPWYRQPSTAVYPRIIGTLVIDLIDADKNELVWRGWAQGIVDRESPDDELIDGVSKVLDDFPPDRG